MASRDDRSYQNERGKKPNSNRRRSQDQKNRRSTLVAILSVAAAVVLLAGWFVVEKYSPSKEIMSGYDYFDVTAEDGVLLMIDGEQVSKTGKVIDTRVYLSQEDVQQYLNCRFYYDAETQGVLYTTSSTIYTFMPDMTSYSDSEGKVYSEEYAMLRKIDGAFYIDLAFVAERTACSYVYAKNPDRVVVRTDSEEMSVVRAKNQAAVRYRAGYKSDILERAMKGDTLYYLDQIDEWYQVVTASGYTGYVKTSEVSSLENVMPEYAYQESYQVIQKEQKVNMGWFQVTSVAANTSADALVAQTSGMNTISPTWYSIADSAGNLSGIVSQSLVDRMHGQGIEVWPLINDFDKEIDYKALFSSKKARNNMINQLIWDAVNYGFDGLNIDFENVKAEYADDYLQFIRELSVMCEKRNIVLSIDNYKPASFNRFYNLKEQAVFADYVIIMGYDEHYSGSDAGSVASIGYVEGGITGALKQVPAAQLINALPFYTRLWTEASTGTTSKAVGMQAAMDAINENGGIVMWDEESAQYVCSYEKDGALVRVWLEEEKSIAAKMKLYSVYNLAGVAEWKLGLEKPEVWSAISEGLNY